MRVGRQQLAGLKSRLSERDMAILTSVGGLRFMTARQVQVCYFDHEHPTPAAAARSCHRALRRLTDWHLLFRLERQVGGTYGGSSGFVYRLGPAGRRLFNGNTRQGGWEPSTTFLDHTLAISELVTVVVAAERRGDLGLVEVATEPRCWRQLPGYGRNDTLRPDLRLVLARGDLEFHWWVEVDRGSEHGPWLRRKCQQYIRYWQSGVEQASVGVFARVAWLTATDHDADRLRQVIANLDCPAPLFDVGLLDDPLTVLAPAEAES
jgi:hypothetical protein